MLSRKFKHLSDHTDEALLTLISKSNQEAFEELFNRYWRKIHQLAYSKLKDPAATDEIVQDFFVTIWKRRASLAIQSFDAYLYTSVKHRCINYFERFATRQKHRVNYESQQSTSDNSTDHTLAYLDLKQALDNGIERIPKASKEIFKLSRVEGKSIREIASLMNVSEKAIEYHLTRSLKVLRVYLKEFILTVIFYIFQG